VAGDNVEGAAGPFLGIFVNVEELADFPRLQKE
jgi:hypothetical protein